MFGIGKRREKLQWFRLFVRCRFLFHSSPLGLPLSFALGYSLIYADNLAKGPKQLLIIRLDWRGASVKSSPHLDNPKLPRHEVSFMVWRSLLS